MSKVDFQYLLTNLILQSFTFAPSDEICDDREFIKDSAFEMCVLSHC